MSDHPIEYRDPQRDLGVPAPYNAAPFGGGGGHPFDDDDEEEGGANLQRYLAAILRFKWLILVVTFLGGALGIVLSRTVVPEYRTQATLWIQSQSRTQNTPQPFRPAQTLPSGAWMELIRSRAVLEPVVRDQRLYVRALSPDPGSALEALVGTDSIASGGYRLTVDSTGSRYVIATLNDSIVEQGRIGGAVGRTLGVRWNPPSGSLNPGQNLDFYLQSIRGATESLGSRLQPTPDRQGNFLSLSLAGSDPVAITNTVNAIIDQYLKVATELTQSQLAEVSQALGDQLAVAERDLHSAETALQAFQVNTITLPSDRGSPVSAGLQMTQDPVYDNFFQMRIERDGLQRDRETITRVLQEARSNPQALFALETVPSTSRSPALQQALAELTLRRTELRGLLHRYTEQNPQVIRERAAIENLEQRTIPNEAAMLLAELGTRDTELNSLVQSASAELQSIPPRVIEEARLERNVAIAEHLYTTLQSRYEEARLAAVSSLPDIRSLDPALVPQHPTNGGSQTRLLMMMLLGSFGLSLGGAILLDRFDPKVRYPDQISNDMGLSILGAVPFIRGGGRIVDGGKDASHAIEAFREIRMNVAYAYGAAGPVVFTVSSAEAGDGKSFTSANLAMAFAQQGKRTLIIDGDIRRGRLHRFLGVSRTPGLSDLLARQMPLQEVVQQTDVPLVSLIGSGTRMHVGPELLGSSAMASHLHELKRNFDVIVIDSPPLGAGVDPYVLSALSGNLLMVVRTGNTNRAFAEAKLKLFERLPVRMLGAVMNGIPTNQRAYRYYSYLPDYGVQDEPEQLVAER